MQGLYDALADLQNNPEALTSLGLTAGGLAIAPAALPVAGGLILTAKLITSIQANKSQQDIAKALAECKSDLTKLRADQNYAVHVILWADNDAPARAEENAYLAAVLQGAKNTLVKTALITDRNHSSIAHKMAETNDPGAQELLKFIRLTK